jgi:hypothetical protein
MPPPILLPRKPLSSHPCVFAFSECAEKALGSYMDIIDMTIDVFSRFKAAIALWASFRVGVGFEMTANSTLEKGVSLESFSRELLFHSLPLFSLRMGTVVGPAIRSVTAAIDENSLIFVFVGKDSLTFWECAGYLSFRA